MMKRLFFVKADGVVNINSPHTARGIPVIKIDAVLQHQF